MLPASAADEIALWWPNQMGQQPLYTVTITFTPSGPGAVPITTTRRIGFRLAAMVTINDTDAATVAAAAGKEGQGNHTVMLRVNGAAVMARGANLVPMETMEGRYTAGMFRYLVASAAQAGFNTIRVWGGGILDFVLRFPASRFSAMNRHAHVVYPCAACSPLLISARYPTACPIPGFRDLPSRRVPRRCRRARRDGHPGCDVFNRRNLPRAV